MKKKFREKKRTNIYESQMKEKNLKRKKKD